MKKWTKISLFVLMLLAVFIWVGVAKSPTADEADKNVRLYFFNVGQGDSEMIEMGSYQILIDGGPDDKVLTEIGKVMPVSDRKIETVILTHPHADHLTGLNQILDRYEIGKIYYSGVETDSNINKEFLSKVKSKNIPLEVPEIGTKIDPFSNGELEFLWPGEKYNQKTIPNLNNASEVTRFCYLSHCALYTGDIETDEQAEMFDYYAKNNSENILQSELLKLAHHGSTNGTNQLTLEKIKPKIGIIEVGANNTYGHPHAATLDLLLKGSIQQYRTDQSGTVEFVVNQDGFIKK